MVNLEPVVNRCKFDLATTYSNFWGYQVVRYAKEQGLNYKDLDGKLAVKPNWDPAIQERPQAFACGTGHGNPTKYSGQNMNILLDLESTADQALMTGRYGSFLSCSFGQGMQKWLDAGMRTFLGYREDYVFVAGTHAPDDAIAQTFGNSHHAYDLAFLDAKQKGVSDKEADEQAYQASQARYQKEYENARYPEHRQYLKYCQIIQVHGAKVEEQPPPPPENKYCILPEWLRRWLKCRWNEATSKTS